MNKNPQTSSNNTMKEQKNIIKNLEEQIGQDNYIQLDDLVMKAHKKEINVATFDILYTKLINELLDRKVPDEALVTMSFVYVKVRENYDKNN